MAPTTRSTRQTDVEHNSNQSHEGSMDDAAINVQPTNEPGKMYMIPINIFASVFSYVLSL